MFSLESRMKILVTGGKGQLGRAFAELFTEREIDHVGVDLPEIDITDHQAMRGLINDFHPAVIINCAAFTAVDLAETQKEAALAVNGEAVACLAACANEVDALLVQISTDYVFDGTAQFPVDERAAVNPQSVYGRTKLLGEQAAQRAQDHLIARTAWLFGEGGGNFVAAIRRQLVGGAKELKVVADQVGCPTYAADLAGGLLDLIEAKARGVFNVVNDGATTWHGFAEEIVRQLGFSIPVMPLSTVEASRPAPRPAYSVLSTVRLHRAIGRRLPPWQDALSRYLEKTKALSPGLFTSSPFHQ